MRERKVLFEGTMLAKAWRFLVSVGEYRLIYLDCCQRAVLVSRLWEVFKDSLLLAARDRRGPVGQGQTEGRALLQKGWDRG